MILLARALRMELVHGKRARGEDELNPDVPAAPALSSARQQDMGGHDVKMSLEQLHNAEGNTAHPLLPLARLLPQPYP